jgi:hypothetical protein
MGGCAAIRVCCALVGSAALVAIAAPHARAAALIPTNVVANSYHEPFGPTEDSRSYAFDRSTDNSTTFFQAGSFDTFQFNGTDQSSAATDFAGLIYSNPSNPALLPLVFDTVRMDLGRQYNDGGSFNTVPRLFILKTNTDPGKTRPETVGSGYAEVIGAPLTSPNPPTFDEAVANPGGVDGLATDQTPIIFDLASLPIAVRTGYGFAIGGVSGDGGVHFISVSELSATGSVPEPAGLALAGVVAMACDRRGRSRGARK